MDYSEKWGKDVDEAVRLALEDLGLTEDQVMVTVIEEPAKGFLGLGQKLAKVRVEKLVGIEDEPQESQASMINAEQKAGVRDLRKKNKPSGGAQGQGSGGGRPQGSGGGGRDRDRGRDNRDNRDRGRGPSRDRDRDRDYETIDYDFDAKEQLSQRPADLVPAEGHRAAVFLSSMLSQMGLDVIVEPLENDECVYIEVSGNDAKTVIGKRGQTLDSVQYLTNLASNKDREEYKRVVIDVEGYRSRREKTLEKLAVRLASKVKRSGRSVKLEPMNPYERKVIHATLQSVEGVTTRSEGEEPYRRVIIDRER